MSTEGNESCDDLVLAAARTFAKLNGLSLTEALLVHSNATQLCVDSRLQILNDTLKQMILKNYIKSTPQN